MALLIWVAVFVLAGCLTSPSYIGDTTRYANDALQWREGKPAQFWEFGHLLWRPWAFLGSVMVGDLFVRLFGDTPLQAVVRFLMLTSWLCGCASVVLLYRLMSASGPVWVACVGTAALIFSNAFLSYSQSGTPYIPALCFLLLALFLLRSSIDNSGRRSGLSILAATSFAISVSLWFPFILAAPGAASFVLFCAARGKARTLVCAGRWSLFAVFFAAVWVAGLVLFGLGAWGHGVRDVDQLSAWIAESRNNWQQNLTFVRAVTGLPRSMYDMAGDGMLLKRMFFHDPYSPVAWPAVVPGLLKVACFFSAVGLAGFSLLRRWPVTWPTLVLLLSGVLPTLYFALFLFEPGSAERFLPVFPFALLACVPVLDGWKQGRLAAVTLCLLFLTAAVSNLQAMSSGAFVAQRTAVLQRKAALERQVGSRPGLVFVLSARDDFYRLPNQHPLDRDLVIRQFRVLDLLEVASSDLAEWKVQFACWTLAAWRDGRDVWISRRPFVPRPQVSWEWVEGEDPRVRWADLPAFLAGAEIERAATDSADGFVRLLPSRRNRDWLEKHAAIDCGQTATLKYNR